MGRRPKFGDPDSMTPGQAELATRLGDDVERRARLGLPPLDASAHGIAKALTDAATADGTISAVAERLKVFLGEEDARYLGQMLIGERPGS